MNLDRAPEGESIMDWHKHHKRCGVIVPISRLAKQDRIPFITKG